MALFTRLVPIGFCAALLQMYATTPASAFDCAKASTPTENAICARANLKSQDDAMTRVYFELRNSLNKAAKVKLLQAQKFWLSLRANVCDAQSDCLLDETQLWTIKLNTLNPGMVPKVVWRDGNRHRYAIRIEGAVFANATNDAQKLFNREIEAQIAQAPFSEVFEEGHPYDPEYEINFDISFSSPRLISASANHASYSGAHPNYWSDSINIDVRNGKLLAADAIFSAQALVQLSDACRDQVIEAKYETQDGTLEQKRALLEEEYPGTVAKHVADMRAWSFSKSTAEIGFNKYDIGAGVEGAYSCEFPIEKIKSLAIDPSMFAR